MAKLIKNSRQNNQTKVQLLAPRDSLDWVEFTRPSGFIVRTAPTSQSCVCGSDRCHRGPRPLRRTGGGAGRRTPDQYQEW
jgi:hypothetical protein